MHKEVDLKAIRDVWIQGEPEECYAEDVLPCSVCFEFLIKSCPNIEQWLEVFYRGSNLRKLFLMVPEMLAVMESMLYKNHKAGSKILIGALKEFQKGFIEGKND